MNNDLEEAKTELHLLRSQLKQMTREHGEAILQLKASEEKFTSFLPVVERMLNSFYTYKASSGQQ